MVMSSRSGARHSLARLCVSLLLSLGVLAAGLAPPAAANLPPGAGPHFPTLAPVLQQVTPAVVNIAVRARVREENPLFRDPFFRRFFNMPEVIEREVMAAGSGVIVDAERGYVLTNSHVVEHADVIEVTTKDNRRFRARLVGRDPGTDIAVLRIPGSSALVALPMGDSDRLQVGDFVMAIGNPFGLGQTVTGGMVSALGRSVPGGNGAAFIQTDASINPGNSGGALVDMQGRLVGINSAILSSGGGNIGIGFAVPINIARQAMERIIRHGGVVPGSRSGGAAAPAAPRGRIGVAIQDLTPALASVLQTGRRQGAVVAAVEPGMPAARAGLREGDIIVALDGAAVAGAADLQNRIAQASPGHVVRLTVERANATLLVAVRIADARAGGSRDL